MENFKTSRDEPQRFEEDLDSPLASQREKDIRCVYELLQSRRPLGDILDAAVSSIGKLQHCSERLADNPSLSTLPECPKAPAPDHQEIGPPDSEIGRPHDELNSSSVYPLPSQPLQLTHRPRSVRPVRLILITSIVAATIGVGLLSRSRMHRATHVSVYSAPDQPSTASATDPLLHSNSARADETVSVIGATFEVPLRDTPQATHAPEGIRDELHSISPDYSLLLRRGDSLLAAGDVASARLLYERAARAGDAQGALKLAETYDPTFLTLINLIGVRGDVAIAKRWYGRAAALGASEAEILLNSAGEH